MTLNYPKPHPFFFVNDPSPAWHAFALEAITHAKKLHTRGHNTLAMCHAVLRETPSQATPPQAYVGGAPVDAVDWPVVGQTLNPRDFGQTLASLYDLTDQALTTRQLQGKIAFTLVGYEEDARGNFQIPECKAFFRKLNQMWPFWLHFLSPNPDLLRVLFLTLVDTVPIQGDAKNMVRIANPSQAYATAMDMMRAVSILHAHHEIDPERTREICQYTIDVLKSNF